MSEIMGIHRTEIQEESVPSEIAQTETIHDSSDSEEKNSAEIIKKSEWDIHTPIDRLGVVVADAIITYNKRFEDSMVFLQDDQPVQITSDDKGVIKAVPLDYQQVRTVLGRGAEWYRIEHDKKDDNNKIYVNPSKDLALWTISAGKRELPSVPILRGITDGILIDQDWRFVHTKGYDEKTKFYLTKDYEMDPVPDVPTAEHIDEAKECLWELFREVRYKDKRLKQESVNYQNTIFALITAAVRKTWNGALPFLTIQKSSARIGGSLLSEIIGICAAGNRNIVKKIPYPDTAMEYSTKIDTAIMEGTPYVSIDNVTSKYCWSNPTLLAQSTGDGRVDLREFRKNTSMTSCEPKTFFSFNGINMDIVSDVCGRVIPVYLENDKIWQNEVFNVEEEDLRNKAVTLYPKIMWSIEIIYRNWVAHGRPEPKACNGNISAYQRLWREVGGMMQCAGFTQVLDNLKDAQMDYNEADNEAASLLEALGKEFPNGEKFTMAALQEKLTDQAHDKKTNKNMDPKALVNVVPQDWYKLASRGDLNPQGMGILLKPYIDCSVNGTELILRKKKSEGVMKYYLEDRASLNTSLN